MLGIKKIRKNTQNLTKPVRAGFKTTNFQRKNLITSNLIKNNELKSSQKVNIQQFNMDFSLKRLFKTQNNILKTKNRANRNIKIVNQFKIERSFCTQSPPTKKKRSPLNPFGDNEIPKYKEKENILSSPKIENSQKASADSISSSSLNRNNSIPFRRNLDWKNPEFYDKDKLDDEMRRVFEICAGCRMCFNLCDSFPTLFDLIDQTEKGSVKEVKSSDFKKVSDKCTLCDICFLAKCPYVPPHPFDIDFPHLMLRYRINENEGNLHYSLDNKKNEKIPKKWNEKLIREVDIMGKIGVKTSFISNWALQNKTIRKIMEKTLDIHQNAELPKYSSHTLLDFYKKEEENLKPNPKGPSFLKKRKAIIFGTCIGNYQETSIGEKALKILNHTGVETKLIYPECCGMPQLEGGNIKKVTDSAVRISKILEPFVKDGYSIISLFASCSLMMKLEWPNFLPENETVKLISENTFDISEYIIKISKSEGLIEGRNPLKDTDQIILHRACHSKAQNVGFKSQEMLSLIPKLKTILIDRCSGHGGTFGVMKETHETAMKIGKPVFTKAIKSKEKDKEKMILLSDCPLAAQHIKQGVKEESKNNQFETSSQHPIEIFYKSYFEK